MSLIVKIKKQLDNFMLSVDMELTDEVVSVIGMSGSGKSMTLKCIAGIETPDSGFISLNGRVLYDSKKRINLHPGKRRVGYLFQDYALISDNDRDGKYMHSNGTSRRGKSEGLAEEVWA